MKKSERINRELIFLNKKKKFNLIDLMNEFNISKSTALRDINELEVLGLPLYVKGGKNGGYVLLEHSLLPPVYFNEQEILSIFFSLDLLKTLTDTPFEQTYASINRKLLASIDADRQNKVLNMQSVLRYDGVKQIAPVDNLELLFNAIIDCQILMFDYIRYKRQEKKIQPIELIIVDGFWYCLAWDVMKKAWRKYRCEYMKNIHITEEKGRVFTEDEIKSSYFTQEQKSRTLPFRIELSEKGIEHFLKRYYPNMELTTHNKKNYIVGNIKNNEVSVLVHYLLGFGNEIEILEPDCLKKEYLSFISAILHKY